MCSPGRHLKSGFGQMILHALRGSDDRTESVFRVDQKAFIQTQTWLHQRQSSTSVLKSAPRERRPDHDGSGGGEAFPPEVACWLRLPAARVEEV
jgi:hypothetical protein